MLHPSSTLTNINSVVRTSTGGCRCLLCTKTHTLRYAHVRSNAILFSCIPSHAGSTQNYTFPVCSR